MITFSVNPTIEQVMTKGLRVKVGTSDVAREWAGEAYLNCIEGRVRKGSFNLDAYAYACSKNEMYYKYKREVPIISAEESEDRVYGVTEAVVSFTDSNFDSIVENSEVKYNHTQFLDMHMYLMVEEGINLWSMFRRALTSMQDSHVKRFREVVKEYRLEDMVKSILEDKESIPELFEMMEGAVA